MTPASARPDERPTKTRFSTDTDGNEVIYEGFPEGNAKTDEARWAVRKTVILADGSGVDEYWANGNRNKTNLYDNREELNYKQIL